DPTDDYDATNKQYVDTAVGTVNTDVQGKLNGALLYGLNKDAAGNNIMAFNAARAPSGSGNPVPVKIIGVEGGEISKTSNEVVVGSQLYAVQEQITTTTAALSNTIHFDDKAKGGEAYSAYRNNGADATRITGVADGKEETDAVNYKQYTTLNNTISALSTGQSVAGEVKGADAWANGVGTKAVGDYTTALGHGAEALANKATAVGSHAKATAKNSVALGANSVADKDNTVSVGSADNLRRITNVAEGIDQNDVVTVKQLTAALGGGNGGATSTVVAGRTSGQQSVAVGGNSNAGASYATAVGASAQAMGEGASAFGAGAQAMGPGSMAMGNNAYAAGPNDTAIGNNARVEADNSIALGANSLVTANATNAVALGAGSVADAPNTVSVGAPGAERRITNVAPGVLATDAVNVGQLYSETRTIQKEARRGIAATAALAPALTPSAPGKTTVSASTGFYRSEFGFGVSVAHRLDTAMPVMIHAGYANGGGKEHVGRVGVAVEF
ncbi:MAG: hypothetical protein KF735_08080, partial [Chelatococcus sp.]|uniref:YadA family autotransporter adhesin n=1 Tax=Chelatococcus sp. TaxID=1953771 RepID=UPI0025C18275